MSRHWWRSPQSNGAAEGAVGILKGMIRTTKKALEKRIGQPLRSDHPLITWIVQHASGMQRRFKMGHDGRTPHERLVGRKVHTPVAELGECVWYMALRSSADRLAPLEDRYQEGYFMGLVDGKNEVYIASGNDVVRARSVKRRIPAERWKEELYEVVKRAVLATEDDSVRVRAPVQADENAPLAPPDLPDPPAPRKRGTMLMRDDFQEHGYTRVA